VLDLRYIILAGGYALNVTPEKACWLFNPFRLEKKAAFSADTKNCPELICNFETINLGSV
jgi:hypothetical protein